MLDYFHLQIADLYLLLPALSSVDEGRRLYEVRLFERLLPFAMELGVPGITLSPGIETPEITEARMPRSEAVELRPAEKPEADTEMVTYQPPVLDPEQIETAPPSPTPFDHSVDSFRRIVEATEDFDLRVSFEPHLDSVAATPEKALIMLEKVPGLSLTLDWAQFAAQGIISREIEPLLPHTAHVQVRQATRGRLQTPYHEGSIDLQQVVTMLLDNDYRGTIAVEYMNRSGWHGMAALNIIQETGLTRDAIRNARTRIMSNLD
ncbi:sugar phosphate isomerase/epimerase family protein [Chloroflexota bacterium]